MQVSVSNEDSTLSLDKSHRLGVRATVLTSLFVTCSRGQYIEYDFGNIRLPRIHDRHWKNMDFNFDDVGEGMLSLFAVSTFEGWPGYVCRI
jgi:hypothetical protein